MPVIYNSRKLIPAPLAGITKEYQSTEDLSPLGTQFVIQLKGTLVASKGSPTSSGTFWTSSDYPPDESLGDLQTFPSILRKQEAIRTLFAEEGKSLEIQGWDGSAPFKCNPRVRRVEFVEDKWYDRCQYIVTLEADVVYQGGTALGEDTALNQYHISRASEEWSIEAENIQGRVFKLTRHLSATGKRFYNDAGSLVRPAWEEAQLYLLDRVGLGIKPERMEASGVLDASTLQAFDYQRSQQINETAGAVSISESWRCYDPQGEPPAVEDFTVNSRTGEDYITRVSIEGTITGLQTRDNSTYVFESGRYANALDKFNNYVYPFLHTRCEQISNQTLRATLVNGTTGHNYFNGVISYSAEFDNKADFSIGGALSQIVSVNDHKATDVYASIPVIGRSRGPILQDIGTKTSKRRSLSIEIQKAGATQTNTPTEPDTDSIVLLHTPSGTSALFLDQDEVTWVERTGRYTRSVAWTYQQ